MIDLEEMTMTPEQAIERYAAGNDAAAFAVLVRQYQRLVYSAAARLLARREDIEDVTQQTFLALAKSARSIRKDIGGWLYRTACNAATDLVRRDATRRRYESAIVPAGAVDEESARSWRELSAAVDAAMAALPEDERAILAEHFFAGRSQRDLAAAMNVSQPTIGRRIEAAVDSLRQRLSRNGYATMSASMLASGLGGVSHVDVPATVTAGLNKIGLAGSAGAATAAAVGSTIGTAKIVGAIALGLGVFVGIDLVVWKMSGGRTQSSATPAKVAATTGAAGKMAGPGATPLAVLANDYALPDDRDILCFEPPFPASRVAYINAEYPRSGGSSNVNSLGFRFDNGKLESRYMMYPAVGVRRVCELLLELKWYDVEGIEKLPWRAVAGDWVVRAGLTTEQKLAALTRWISEQSGTAWHFDRQVEKRPCIAFRGTTREVPKNGDGFRIVVLSLAPQSPAQMKAWLAGSKRPKSTHSFQIDDATRLVDAPIFDTRVKNSPEGHEEAHFGIIPGSVIVHVTADAFLKRADPNYREKLAAVLKNLGNQVGGEWTIEDREIETWVPVVGVPVK